jgi:trypsin-like peptidase
LSALAYVKWTRRELPNGDLLFEPVMPRIRDVFVNCAVFLYPSVDAAETGERLGGSGFLVSVDSIHAGYHTVYAVTNSHVIREAGSPVVRLNTKDGRRSIQALDADNWVHHPNGDDLAVAPVEYTRDHSTTIVPIDLAGMDMLITPEFIAEHKVGPGDEVFMVGRFVNHEGRQRNAASLRFGNIAQMNEEPIKHERGHWQESFLVEVRSIPGYSGAPVFLFIPPLSPRPEQTSLEASWFIRLLGVDWCHLNQDWSVLDKNDNAAADDDGFVPGYHVRANTGMAGVIPAWKLHELLYCDELVERRRLDDEELSATKRESPASLDPSGTTSGLSSGVLGPSGLRGLPGNSGSTGRRE